MVVSFGSARIAKQLERNGAQQNYKISIVPKPFDASVLLNQNNIHATLKQKTPPMTIRSRQEVGWDEQYLPRVVVEVVVVCVVVVVVVGVVVVSVVLGGGAVVVDVAVFSVVVVVGLGVVVIAVIDGAVPDKQMMFCLGTLCGGVQQ